MAAIAHEQRAAGAGFVPRISERGLCAKGDIGQIDAMRRERPGARDLGAAAIGDSRIDDRHGAADAGCDVEISGRVGADKFDCGYQVAATGDEQRAAGIGDVGGNIAGGNAPGGGDRDEVDELRAVRVNQTAESGNLAGKGARLGLRISDFQPAGAGQEPDAFAAGAGDLDDACAAFCPAPIVELKVSLLVPLPLT